MFLLASHGSRPDPMFAPAAKMAAGRNGMIPSPAIAATISMTAMLEWAASVRAMPISRRTPPWSLRTDTTRAISGVAAIGSNARRIKLSESSTRPTPNSARPIHSDIFRPETFAAAIPATNNAGAIHSELREITWMAAAAPTSAPRSTAVAAAAGTIPAPASAVTR